jgi:hypothetical protein
LKLRFSYVLLLLPLWSCQQQAVAQDDAGQHPLKSTTPAPPSPLKHPPFTPLTGSERFDYFLHHTFGPMAIARSVVWSGLAQAADTPPEWGQGMEGYGKRLAAKFGQHTAKASIQDGTAALLHEDPRYIPSGRTGFRPRLAYAAEHAFLIYRNDGTPKFADSRLIGCFGGAAIARAWYPRGDRTYADILKSGATSFGIDAGMTVVKEFWPDIRRGINRLFR